MARAAGVGRDHLLFGRFLAGVGHGFAGDLPVRLRTDEVHLVDLSRRFRIVTSGVIAEGVLIPRDMVGYDPSMHLPFVSIPVATGPGAPVDHAHRAACHAIAAENASQVTLARAFIALLRSLLVRETDGRGDEQRGPGKLRRIRAYVLRNLRDNALSADHLCVEFDISRATLYRLFETEGGVERYIRARRLDRCFASLTESAPERGQIRRIAESWGFCQAGNFNRDFRKRFGIAPSDCLGVIPREIIEFGRAGRAGPHAIGHRAGPAASVLATH